jgi:hypothetical protein
MPLALCGLHRRGPRQPSLKAGGPCDRNARRAITRERGATRPADLSAGDRIHAKALATRSPAVGGTRQFCLGGLASLRPDPETTAVAGIQQ